MQTDSRHSAAAPPCVLCGAPGERSCPVIERPEGLSPLRRCLDCGLVRATDVPLERQREDRLLPAGPAALASVRFARLRRFVRELPRSGPVLDYGCGRGDLVRLLRRDGVRAYGVDTALHAAPEGDEPLFFPSLDDFMQRSSDAARPAGAVFNYSLEHLADPAGTLRRVGDLLVPGGMIAVTVPDIDACLTGLRTLSAFQLRLPDHRSFFDRRSLARLVAAAGYRVCEIRPVFATADLITPACSLFPGLSPGDADRTRPFGPVRVVGATTLALLSAAFLPYTLLRLHRGTGNVLYCTARKDKQP